MISKVKPQTLSINHKVVIANTSCNTQRMRKIHLLAAGNEILQPHLLTTSFLDRPRKYLLRMWGHPVYNALLGKLDVAK